MKAAIIVLTVLMLSLDSADGNPHGSESLPDSEPKYYEMVRDVPLSDLVSHDGSGTYVKLVRVDTPSKDTILAYVQGVTEGRVRPNYRAAKRADLIIWCYPRRYPHSKHVFPDASGRVYMMPTSEDRFVVMTEDYAQKALSLSSRELRNRPGLSP